ncbi:unnamed protein product [Mytilus coruscus]|uniref:C2H2-type domain-containing protein n=1 Tax=Mytilus coruscus TaxID=42192 RepID=A0A6J8EBQ0_MYTCO|nr:unnamed protein product [Mytilus coruscus]
MSRELVLVSKRKDDDLIRRAGMSIKDRKRCFEAISLVMDIDTVLTDSAQIYPDGSNALENELRTLKRNLNVNEGFTCGICNKVIQHQNNFNRHLKSHKTTHKCFMCNRKFTRIDSLKRHERGHLVGYVRPNDTYNCRHCGLGFKDYTTLFGHSKTMHPVQTGGNANISNNRTTSQNALDDSAHVLTIYPSDEDRYDILTFFSNIRQKIKDTLAERCDKVKHVKWYLNVQVELTRETNDGELDNSQPYFKSRTYMLLSKSDIEDDEINEAFQKQFQSFDEYMARESGWTLKYLINMELHTIQFRPIANIYSDMEKDKHLFDFSNYDKDHFLFDKSNAKKPGLFKDETAGVPIEQFVGLRSKMYSLVYGDIEQKRAKEIVKSVVRGELKHSNYVKCILDQKNIMCQQNLIQSKKHKLHMVNVNKVALSAFDDKRYVMDNGVDTLAFGHYRINLINTGHN